MQTKDLYNQITTEKNTIKKYAPDVIKIPNHISSNLKYNFFDWQKEAFENLLIYEEEHKKNPTHLLFNMATGTGKTLLMASCILHYYKQGYRKFIFFVNQNNIVDKTENNFINSDHNKYLFSEKIIVDNETVHIKKVNTFSSDNKNIEIKFTTIQKLYNDIHIEKENQIYLDDLIKNDIVMLADEGHHLNADTKKKQQELDLKIELKNNASKDDVEKKGWEHTVIELLLNKNGNSENNKNVLLEFTATIPNDEKVLKKYASKILYKFDLKQFLSAGYTKEINLISSTLSKQERMLQALLFNWYRHKIALKNNIHNFKPVILFRSKTIDESKNDYAEFTKTIKNLTVKDFDFLKNVENKFTEGKSTYEQGKSRIIDLIKFIKQENIKKSEIINFIQDNFQERNLIITNSETKSLPKNKTDGLAEDEQKLLNNLEDKNNNIRAIFTVNRLTEGWDVLNLFDIVRLYEGRDEGKDKKGNRKAGSTTISEIQLIGRGVRYYPFTYENKQANKRKFDNNLDNELRVLEELYYHSDSDHRYIDELKRELKKEGFIDDNKIEKSFKIKKDFAKSSFYKNIKIWKNEQTENPKKKQQTLKYLKDTLKPSFESKDFSILEEGVNLKNENKDNERLNVNNKNKRTLGIEIKEFDKNIFEKAIHIKSKNSQSLLRFNAIKEEIPVNSIYEIQQGTLGDFKVKITTTKSNFEEIENKEKLNFLLKFLDLLLAELKKNINPYIGTEFKPYELKEFFDDEVRKRVLEDDESREINNELESEDWYVLDNFHGTSEEKGLIKFIQNYIQDLRDNYKKVYLLRNEEQYKIYNFTTGQGFQPDFILFLKGDKELYYQVFIEPKGDNLLEKDNWKNEFLKEITNKYADKNILKVDSKDYILIGLPLFNKNNNNEFEDEYNKLIK